MLISSHEGMQQADIRIAAFAIEKISAGRHRK